VKLTTPKFLSVQPKGSLVKIRIWIKRLGFWGLMFFLVKGLLWLTIPALISVLATNCSGSR